MNPKNAKSAKSDISSAVSLYVDRNNEFFLVQDGRRTQTTITIQGAVYAYLKYRLPYPYYDDIIKYLDARHLITLEPNEIKDLHLTHPELFL